MENNAENKQLNIGAVINCNLNHLINALLQGGYKKDGDWYIDGDFRIKLNKRTIYMKGARGTQLTYANPNKITVEDLENIIQAAMV